MSKLLECFVARQHVCYLESYDLITPIQSSFRLHHSTDTTVLSVLSDILTDVDQGDITALALQDLMAGFDTVDHGILVNCLQRSFRTNGSVLWFQSYLGGCTQSIRHALVQL